MAQPPGGAPGAAAEPGLLPGHEDNYDGLILDPEGLPESPEEFAEALDTSLASWRSRGYRGIWLKVPKQRAHFVGHAVDRGFDFHHAEKVVKGGQQGRGLGRAGLRVEGWVHRLHSSWRGGGGPPPFLASWNLGE